MIAEINLLTEKERKNIAGLIILLGFVLFLIVIFAVTSFQYAAINNQKNQISAELQTARELKLVEENKLKSFTDANAVKDLQSAVNWIESLPVSSVYILKHLTALLPERGFILNYQYSDNGTVSLNVQFDTNRQAAFYLKALKDSEYISNANLKTLTTVKIDDSNETIVPRYVGSFTISLNKEILRKTEEEGGEKK